MVSIRLSRIGKKGEPSYRIIALDKRKDPWGDYLEDLGYYNPLTNPFTLNVKAERLKYWISKGAQPSSTLHNLLIEAKVIEGQKVRIGKPKKIAQKQEALTKGEKQAIPQEQSSKTAASPSVKESPPPEVK
jgi:small subunit ribosomal protein S16